LNRSAFFFFKTRGACLSLCYVLTSHPNLQEQPQVLTAIANASSAANNLVNAITVCLLQFRGWVDCSCLSEARQHRER
jgi:hypothetical protein